MLEGVIDVLATVLVSNVTPPSFTAKTHGVIKVHGNDKYIL